MADIVERLRDRFALTPETGAEAADEIERLREENDHYRKNHFQLCSKEKHTYLATSHESPCPHCDRGKLEAEIERLRKDRDEAREAARCVLRLADMMDDEESTERWPWLLDLEQG